MNEASSSCRCSSCRCRSRRRCRTRPAPMTATTPISNTSRFRPHGMKNRSAVARHPATVGMIMVRPGMFRSSRGVARRLHSVHPMLVGFRGASPRRTTHVMSFMSNTACTLSNGLRGMNGSVFVYMPMGVSVSCGSGRDGAARRGRCS